MRVFKHDCETCEFLAHVEGCDLYYHDKMPRTFVARYGNNGPDYLSDNGRTRHPILVIAVMIKRIRNGKFSGRPYW